MSNKITRAFNNVGAQLAPLFNNEEFELAKRAMIDCLGATVRVRAGRDASGSYVYEDQADNSVRLVASRLILEWCAGKPITRALVTSFTPEDNGKYEKEFFAAILRDPGEIEKLRRTFEKMVDAATATDVTATKLNG